MLESLTNDFQESHQRYHPQLHDVHPTIQSLLSYNDKLWKNTFNFMSLIIINPIHKLGLGEEGDSWVFTEIYFEALRDTSIHT